MGGGGAVGFAAIQLCVATGCHVSTTCGSQSLARILAAGAEQAVDYTSEVMMISSDLFTLPTVFIWVAFP